MTGLRGVLAGVLVLVTLEAVLSTDAAASRATGLFGTLAGIVDHLLDPNVAAIPDRRGGSAVVGEVFAGPGGPVVIAPGGDLPDPVSKYKPTRSAS